MHHSERCGNHFLAPPPLPGLGDVQVQALLSPSKSSLQLTRNSRVLWGLSSPCPLHSPSPSPSPIPSLSPAVMSAGNPGLIRGINLLWPLSAHFSRPASWAKCAACSKAFNPHATSLEKHEILIFHPQKGLSSSRARVSQGELSREPSSKPGSGRSEWFLSSAWNWRSGFLFLNNGRIPEGCICSFRWGPVRGYIPVLLLYLETSAVVPVCWSWAYTRNVLLTDGPGLHTLQFKGNYSKTDRLNTGCLSKRVLYLGDVDKMETHMILSLNQPHALKQSLLKTKGYSNPFKSLIENSFFFLFSLDPSERQLCHVTLRKREWVMKQEHPTCLVPLHVPVSFPISQSNGDIPRNP